MSTLSVLIGRFQSPHPGHLDVVDHAIAHSTHLLILVGSANRARSSKNPFTFEERKAMLLALCSNPDKITILPLDDSLYDDSAWERRVRIAAQNVARQKGLDTIALTGFDKDKSTAYLSWFPDWTALPIEPIADSLGLFHATDLRHTFWTEQPLDRYGKVADILTTWKNDNPALFAKLQQEYKAASASKKRVNDAAAILGYPIALPTVDTLVRAENAVLLIERAHAPGKGLLAMPGGFVDRFETSRKAAARELYEETGLMVNAADLKGGTPFDHPERSERGWIRTEVFTLTLPEKVFVTGDGQETTKAVWKDINTLNPRDFFEDHYDIITTLLGQEEIFLKQAA